MTFDLEDVQANESSTLIGSNTTQYRESVERREAYGSGFEIPIEFQCAYCGEFSDASVDTSQGAHQSYVEDCSVCCRPNLLYISINEETRGVMVSAFFEG